MINNRDSKREKYDYETHFTSCYRWYCRYKAIDLTSKLTQAGYDVRVMLSEHAQEFVTPLAFQAISRNPVYTNTFKEENPQEIQHIALGDWADAIVVARYCQCDS